LLLPAQRFELQKYLAIGIVKSIRPLKKQASKYPKHITEDCIHLTEFRRKARFWRIQNGA